MQAGEEIARSFFVAGRDTSELFDELKETLDEVALGVEGYPDSISRNQSSLILVPHRNGADSASGANGVLYFGAGPCRFQITPSLQVIVRPSADSRPVLRKQATPSAPRGFPWNSPPYSFTHSASPPLTPMLGLASVRRQP
jgi:hypothetical protein